MAMPDLGLGDGAAAMGAIAILLTALGLSSASGLRAYFPLLAVAVGSDIPTGDGHTFITLSKPFQSLGTPWLIALLAILALGEFAVDKVPGLDHASDAVHTIVRPIAGAVVMAGISNPLSDADPWAAAVVGAVLALGVHGTKAVARPAVTATTAGIGNPVVSVGEDLVTLVMTLLALLAPLLAFIFFVLLLLLIGRPVARGVRRLFGGQPRRRVPAANGPYRPLQPYDPYYDPYRDPYRPAPPREPARTRRRGPPEWPYPL